MTDRASELSAAAEQRALFYRAAGIAPGTKINTRTRFVFPVDVTDEQQQRVLDRYAHLNRSVAAPADLARLVDASAEMRASTITRDGEERIHVQGIASVTDTPYEMYDFAGPYNETVRRPAISQALTVNPDVSFLVNHKGITMARTKNGSLQLRLAPTGLQSDAYLNPKRNDVHDLVCAMNDGQVTEMSFAFMLEEGEWSEDFRDFYINQLSLERGDVSAVNYGANPYTSIAARTPSIIHDLRHIPTGAAREAIRVLSARADLAAAEREQKAFEVRESARVEQEQRDAAAATGQPVKMGRSIALVEALEEIDD